MQQELNTTATDMANTKVDIKSTTQSGIGSYMSVTIGDKIYTSQVTKQELDENNMRERMLEIYEQLPDEYAQAVKTEFEKFIQAIANTKAELEYREAHPEEFLHEQHEFQ